MSIQNQTVLVYPSAIPICYTFISLYLRFRDFKTGTNLACLFGQGFYSMLRKISKHSPHCQYQMWRFEGGLVLDMDIQSRAVVSASASSWCSFGVLHQYGYGQLREEELQFQHLQVVDAALEYCTSTWSLTVPSFFSPSAVHCYISFI